MDIVDCGNNFWSYQQSTKVAFYYNTYMYKLDFKIVLKAIEGIATA